MRVVSEQAGCSNKNNNKKEEIGHLKVELSNLRALIKISVVLTDFKGKTNKTENFRCRGKKPNVIKISKKYFRK